MGVFNPANFRSTRKFDYDVAMSAITWLNQTLMSRIWSLLPKT
jgi:hypothetical protein